MCCSHYNSNTPSQIQRQKIIVSKKIEEAYTKSILDSEMCFGLSPSASVRSTHCSGYLLGKLLRSILMYTVCLAFQVGCACAKNCQALFSWTSPPKQLAIIQGVPKLCLSVALVALVRLPDAREVVPACASIEHTFCVVGSKALTVQAINRYQYIYIYISMISMVDWPIWPPCEG